jgi:hypothetical protein
MVLLKLLTQELMNQGHSIPIDVAVQLIEAGYDIENLEDSLDGLSIIDPTEVDYFDYIDQNH